MKMFLNAITLTFLSLIIVHNSAYADLDPNPECDAELKKHTEIMKVTSEQFDHYINEEFTDLTPYQVTQFEHYFTTRVKHLATLRNSHCKLKALRELVISSDYINIGKTLLADTKLRRIIANLIVYKKNDFAHFKSELKKYTDKKYLDANLDWVFLEDKENEVDHLGLNLDVSGVQSMTTFSDLTNKALTKAIAKVAINWGKLSDATIWREGHLKDNQDALLLLRANLKPFDLVYESRNYTLSHFTIPGNFGHVAIWMGSESQLKELGLWEKDFMAPFRKAILEGKNIIEIRKPGVQFVALENFINLDEIAVTRINQIADNNNGENIFKNLALQFGKKYDFTFNAHSSDKITCAELVAFTYGDIKWPNIKKAGVVNLRPDDMAMYMFKEPTHSSFVLYLRGNEDGKAFENLDFEAFRKVFFEK